MPLFYQHNKFTSYIGIFILVSVCVIVFSPYLENFFVIDDIDFLEALFRDNNFSSCFRQPFIMPFRFRPTEHILFFVCYNLFGINPRGYFFLFMVISIIGLIVLYNAILMLTKNEVLSFFSTFLVTIHPLNIQKYSILTNTSLSFLFFSSTLLCYFLYLSRQKGNKRFYILSLLFYSIAVLSREDVFILPLFILIYHLLFDTPFDGARLIKRMTGYLVITCIYFIIRFPILGLWISLQKCYSYDFLNISHMLYNYKMYTTLAFRIIVNPFNFISHLNLYMAHLIAFKKMFVIFFIFIILFFLTLEKKGSFIQAVRYKNKVKLFLMGIFWYLAGLLPYVFIADNLHHNLWYLVIPIIGLSLSISTAMVLIHQIIYHFNRYLAHTISLFLIISIFCTTLLMARRVDIDKRFNYFGFADMATLTRKCITTIKKSYDIFPMNSQIYLVDFPWLLRVQSAIPIFYNDKSLKTYLITDEELEKLNFSKDNDIFIFKLYEDKEVFDLTPK